MAQQGTTTLDFGAFPGASDASVVVSGLTGSPALVEAWLYPQDTVDHLADEHWTETLGVRAGPVSGGSFTVYGWNINQINEPLVPTRGATGSGGVTSAQSNPGSQDQYPQVGGLGTLIYGKWTVAWVAN